MHVLVLGTPLEPPQDWPVANFLKKMNVEVTETSDLIGPLTAQVPNLIVCHRYRHILSPQVLAKCKRPPINLHPSFLPWNRGAYPNFWAWKEQTPHGVTIHEITHKIDFGPVIVQELLQLEAEDFTLKTSYDYLQKELISLFQMYWDAIKIHSYKTVPMRTDVGSYHSVEDFEEEQIKLAPFNWATPCKNFRPVF